MLLHFQNIGQIYPSKYWSRCFVRQAKNWAGELISGQTRAGKILVRFSKHDLMSPWFTFRFSACLFSLWCRSWSISGMRLPREWSTASPTTRTPPNKSTSHSTSDSWSISSSGYVGFVFSKLNLQRDQFPSIWYQSNCEHTDNNCLDLMKKIL